MMIECPHCSARVRLGEDGICPVCARRVRLKNSIAVDVIGRRLPTIPGIALGVILGVTVALSPMRGWGGGVVVLLFFLVPVFLSNLALFLRPPRITVQDGTFSARLQSRTLRCPVSEILSVTLAGTKVRIILVDAAARDAVHATSGGSLTQRVRLVEAGGGFFTENQVDRIRAALGQKPQADDIPPTALDEFYRRLYALTPRVFVTPAIVTLTIAIFAIMVGYGVHPFTPEIPSLLAWGAGFGAKTLGGEWWRLFTPIFLHIGILHLYINMYVLAYIGPTVERLVGRLAFLVLYLLSGAAGSFASAYWNPTVTSAGASGAVFGVFGALLGFLLLRRDSVPIEALRDLRFVGGFFVVANVVFGLSIPAIDMAAHVGGLAAGFLCGIALSAPVTREARFRRTLQTIAVAACGAILIVLAIRSPSSSLSQYDRAWAATRRAEQAQHELDSGQYNGNPIGALAEEIIPLWRKARVLATTIQNVPPRLRNDVARLSTYLGLRHEAAVLRLEWYQTNDPKIWVEWQKKENAVRAFLEMPPEGEG